MGKQGKLAEFSTQKLSQIRACAWNSHAWASWLHNHVNILSWKHAPLGQSERAYYLSYFVNNCITWSILSDAAERSDNSNMTDLFWYREHEMSFYALSSQRKRKQSSGMYVLWNFLLFISDVVAYLLLLISPVVPQVTSKAHEMLDVSKVLFSSISSLFHG